MNQVLAKVCDVGVDCHLILPLKLCPHLAELRVCAGSWHNVVHDVYMDVVEHHTVAVASSSSDIIH